MLMDTLYYENLCKKEEYAKKDFKERKEYLDNLFGGGIHKVYAEIIEIYENYMKIEALYFLINESMIRFQLFIDEDNSKIGTSASWHKINSLKEYCKENGLKRGDKIICQVNAVKGYWLISFDLTSIEKNVIDVENLYKRYDLKFEPDKVFIGDDNKKALIEGDLSQGIEEKLQETLNKIKEKERELKETINNYDFKLQLLKQARINAIENEIKNKEKEKDEELERIKDDFRKQTEVLEKKEEGLNKQIKEQEKKLGFLKRFAISLEPNRAMTNKKHELQYHDDFIDFDEMIKYAQGYLLKNYQLSYPKELLQSFYLGLQTNQLILLMGKPGTGKTSLVKKFAEMFGFADAAIIPVQSNWSDKGDLLGYYNPLEKNYITTQFLDSLLEFCKEAEKEENKEKLFFICLDEMNLAHIEYYFAEFLSILQGDKRLRLYSKIIKEDIIRELKYSGFTDEEIKDLDENHISLNEKQIVEKVDNDQLTILKRQYYLNLCRMANMIANIPDEIKIPERIKFIGTLNQDATTLDISPKVLDRAYVIRINDRNIEDIKLIDNGQYDEKLRYLPVKKFAETNDYDGSLIKDALSSIRKITYYSQRICKQTFDNESFSTWCKVIGTKSTIDFILAATFLPKIRIYSEDKTYNDKERELEKLGNNYDMVAGIVSEIKTEDGIDFWRS